MRIRRLIGPPISYLGPRTAGRLSVRIGTRDRVLPNRRDDVGDHVKGSRRATRLLWVVGGVAVPLRWLIYSEIR